MTSLSTHVLDVARGLPAVGLAVELLVAGAVVESATTDDDGRIAWATAVGADDVGLRFATGPWFAAGGRETFFPSIDLAISPSVPPPHTHVALLLSPFAYTTYRGS